MELLTSTLDSPIGAIIVVTQAGRLCALEFVDEMERSRARLATRFNAAALPDATDAAGVGGRLRRYFEGDLEAIQDIDVHATGTEFQQRVWHALRTIPIGSTLSYGQLAERIGNAKASRAVGLANSQNPIGIVVPCHRVIGANAELTGYAGGLERKKWLLRHEGVEVAESSGTGRVVRAHADERLTLF